MAFSLLVLLQKNGVKLLGFEPRQTESKSVVLPLHHNLIFVAKIGYNCDKIFNLEQK